MIRTFIPWYGGKHFMCKSLKSFIPYGNFNTFVEVFGGGMRVLINSPSSPVEVYNDLDEGLVAIFRCMKDINKAKILRERLWNSPYSKSTFDYALKHYNDYNLEEIEKARLKFILITQSFNSVCKTFRNPTSPKIIKTYNNRIINMLDFVPRFKDIIVENLDFKEVMDKYDSSDTFFYLDPPYVSDTRGAPNVYQHEGDDNLHISIVDKLLTIEGRFLLSGYDHPLYDRISSGNFSKTKLGDFTKPSQVTSKGGTKSKGSEYLWQNY